MNATTAAAATPDPAAYAQKMESVATLPTEILLSAYRNSGESLSYFADRAKEEQEAAISTSHALRDTLEARGAL